MKVMIVGALGQLGRALQDRYRGHDVTAMSHGDLDISDEARVREAVAASKPDLLLNAAAYNQVDRAETDEAGAFSVNEAGPRHLARAAASVGARFVHVSTDYVFDGQKGRPYVESDPTNPVNAYGRSKLAGEVSALREWPSTCVVRTSWVYHTVGKNFLFSMLALSKKGPVEVVSDQFSCPTYAPHLADAIARLAASGASGVYHVAGAGTASRYEELRAFYDAIGARFQVTPVPMSDFPQAARRPRRTEIVSEREPRIALPPWTDGIAEFARDLKHDGIAF